MEHIVITGSTRGIGFGMARHFLEKGYSVTVSGSRPETVEAALEQLEGYFPKEKYRGVPCNIVDRDQIVDLWRGGIEAFGSIDVWINNAGMNQPQRYVTEIEEEEFREVLEVDLISTALNTRYIYSEMIRQGHGQIYNMEGFGSDGRKNAGTTVYGLSKRGIRYFTESFALESEGITVQICLLSPGIVLTDFILDPIREDPEGQAAAIKIYNILGDEVEPVTDYLTDRIIENLSKRRHGVRFSWLKTGRILLRFLSAPFRNRKLVERHLSES